MQENLDLIFTIIWSFAIANTIWRCAVLLFESGPGAGAPRFPSPGWLQRLSSRFFLAPFKVPQNSGDLFAMLRFGTAGLAHEAVGLAARPFSGRFRYDQAHRTVLIMAIDQPLRSRMALAGLRMVPRPFAPFSFPYTGAFEEKAGVEGFPAEESGRGTAVGGRAVSVLFTLLVSYLSG